MNRINRQLLFKHIYTYPLSQLKLEKQEQLIRSGKLWFNFAKLNKRPSLPHDVPVFPSRKINPFNYHLFRSKLSPHQNVVQYLQKIVFEPLTIHHMAHIYKLLTNGHNTYRSKIIKRSRIIHPLPDEIWILMQWIMHDYRTMPLHPFILIINFICNFLFINPFENYNEVIAYYILNKELARWGYGGCLISSPNIFGSNIFDRHEFETCFYHFQYAHIYKEIEKCINETIIEEK